MGMTPQGKAVPFLAGALVIVALAGGGVALYRSGHAVGEEGERKTWQAKWNEEAARLATLLPRPRQSWRLGRKSSAVRQKSMR